MANIREIKTRMNSIEDTLKITNAIQIKESKKAVRCHNSIL